jgi:hypothetical protein
VEDGGVEAAGSAVFWVWAGLVWAGLVCAGLAGCGAAGTELAEAAGAGAVIAFNEGALPGGNNDTGFCAVWHPDAISRATRTTVTAET